MATNRKRVSRNREADIAPELMAWFKDAAPRRPALVFFLLEGELRKAWDTARHAVLAEWAESHPGARPAHWWLFDAPEQRQRIGGKGTPCHEGLAHAPRYNLGIPADWVSDNWIDPPVFESQATFLRRHKLFLSGEEKRLSADAYAPEVLTRLPGQAET